MNFKKALLLALCMLQYLRASSDIKDDDFCDNLSNGSDELHTSACSGLSNTPNYFKCTGGMTALTKQLIPTSRVNDGICDCCDGSDEQSNTITTNCPNICEAQEAGEKDRLRLLEAVRTRGLLLRQSSITIATAELQNLKEAQRHEKEQLPELNKKLTEKEEELEDLRRIIGIRQEDAIHEANIMYEISMKQLFSISHTKVTIQNINSIKDHRKVIENIICAIVLRSREEWSGSGGGLGIEGGSSSTISEKILHAVTSKYILPGSDADDSQVLVLSLEIAPETDISVGFYHVSPQNNHHIMTNIGVFSSADLANYRDNIRLAQDSMDLMSEALSLSRLSIPLKEEDSSGTGTDMGMSSLYHVLHIAVQAAHHHHILALCLLDAGFIPIGNPLNDDHTRLGIAQAVDFVLNKLPQSPHMIKQQQQQQQQQSDTDHQSIQHLEKAIISIKKEKDILISRSKSSQEILRYNYGENDYLFALYGTCANIFDKQYRYSVCPFKQAHQDSTLLGIYKSYEKRSINAAIHSSESSGKTSEIWLIYAGGAYCHATRRSREMHIRLQCADIPLDKSYLSEIEEYEVCMYKATLHTHIACESIDIDDKEMGKGEHKDEL
jgi:hypothetical protein